MSFLKLGLIFLLPLFTCYEGPLAEKSPLKFKPDPDGRRQVWVETVDGTLRWRLRIPERAFCEGGVLVNHDFRKVQTPIDWKQDDDGSLHYRRSNRDDFGRDPRAGKIRYEVRIVPRSFGADISMSVQNTGEETLTNILGHICLGHLSEPFRDPEYERQYIRSDGAYLNLNKTDRGSNPIRTHYGVRGYRVIELFNRPDTPFWGTPSPELADNGMILTRSKDGTKLMALWFDPAGELFQNSDDSNMCIHSDPAYGDLAPGKSVNVEGRLILFDGDLEEFESQFLR